MKVNWSVLAAGTIGFLLATCIFLSLALMSKHFMGQHFCRYEYEPSSLTKIELKACLESNGAIFPPEGATIDTNNPTFDINGVAGIKKYFIQVDSTASFSNPTNTIPKNGSYILPAKLEDGMYFWRVSCNTDEGKTLPWGKSYNFSVSTK